MKFFISHSSKDNVIVKRILEIFDKYEIEYWVDQKELKGEGHSLWTEINNGLESSDHFLLVFSRHVKDSEYVKKEFMAIITPEYDTIMVRIVLRLDDTTLWPLANNLKYHDNVSKENIEDVMNEILQNVLGVDIHTIQKFDTFLDANNKQIGLGEGNYYLYSHVLRSTDRKLYNRKFEEWLEQYLRKDDNY